MEYLDKLAEIAHKHGTVLSVEDLPRSRTLTFANLTKYARQIFAGIPPTRIL